MRSLAFIGRSRRELGVAAESEVWNFGACGDKVILAQFQESDAEYERMQ